MWCVYPMDHFSNNPIISNKLDWRIFETERRNSSRRIIIKIILMTNYRRAFLLWLFEFTLRAVVSFRLVVLRIDIICHVSLSKRIEMDFLANMCKFPFGTVGSVIKRDVFFLWWLPSIRVFDFRKTCYENEDLNSIYRPPSNVITLHNVANEIVNKRKKYDIKLFIDCYEVG